MLKAKKNCSRQPSKSSSADQRISIAPHLKCEQLGEGGTQSLAPIIIPKKSNIISNLWGFLLPSPVQFFLIHCCTAGKPFSSAIRRTFTVVNCLKHKLINKRPASGELPGMWPKVNTNPSKSSSCEYTPYPFVPALHNSHLSGRSPAISRSDQA